MSSGDGAQDFMLSWKVLLPVELSCWPVTFFFQKQMQHNKVVISSIVMCVALKLISF